MQDNNNDIVQNVILNYDTNANEVKAEVGGLSNEVDNLNTATETTEKTFTSLKAQLRQANQELLKSSQVYGETSKEAVKAAKKVAELKDQMQFAKDLTDNFNPDQKFKALGAATQISATGISGVTSGMALFGDQSKDTEQTLLKVQAAMAFSDSISSLSDLGDQWQTLKTVIGASTTFTKVNTAATALASVAQKAFTGSVDTTSTSFKVLRGAIIGTGIGILVGGLVALIANFDKVKRVVLNLVPGLASVGDFIGSIVDKVTDFVGVTSDATRAVDKMLKESEATIRKNQDFLDAQGDKYDEYTKRKIQANIDYAQKVKEVNEDETRTEENKQKFLKALREKADREILQADKDRQKEKDDKAKEEQDKIDAKNKKISDKIKEQAKKDAEDLAKAKAEQLENTKALENEITQVIGDAQDKNAEAFMSAREVEERTINDKYFRLKELAKQQGRDINDIEIQQMNEINDVRLAYQAKEKEQADKKKDEDLEREKAIAEGKKAIQDATINNISAGISLISQLGGKNKAIQKGALIAESAVGVGKIVINTQTANAIAAASPINAVDPTYAARMQVLNNISAGIGIASNIAATAKALGALGGGSAGGGGTSLPNGTTPKVGFQTSAENQIATTIKQTNENQPIVKAIVVANEVTTAQSLNRNKVVANSI